MFNRSVVCPPINRKCSPEECDIEDGGFGKLVKTGVRYGQQTPEEPLNKGTKQAEQADLAIVLGSSMKTSPFCEMPLLAKKMIIVNISPTPYDDRATLLIRTQTDNFMREVVRIMEVSLPPFIYQQKFRLGYELLENGSYKIYANGDQINEPVTCFSEVHVSNGKSKKELTQSSITKVFVEEIPYEKGEVIQFELIVKEEYGVENRAMEIILEKDKDYVVGIFSKTVIYE